MKVWSELRSCNCSLQFPQLNGVCCNGSVDGNVNSNKRSLLLSSLALSTVTPVSRKAIEAAHRSQEIQYDVKYYHSNHTFLLSVIYCSSNSFLSSVTWSHPPGLFSSSQFLVATLLISPHTQFTEDQVKLTILPKIVIVEQIRNSKGLKAREL